MRLNEATDWLARASSNRLVSLGLVAAVVATDAVLLRQSWGFVVRGVLDEPCHLATAILVLGTITRWRGGPPSWPFTWAMLIASVAIDLDHLPAELAARGLLYGQLPRPYTHALWLLVLLAVIAVVAGWLGRVPGRPRTALAGMVSAGAAWGVAAHFLRDITTAPIALLWPVSGAWLRVPYWWYLAGMLILVALPLGHLPAMNILTLHARIYEATDGRIGHRLVGVPCLLLRTTGRKTGLTRTSALVYARDGGRYLLVASNNGSDRPPAWLLNLRQDPAVEFQVARRHRRAAAAVVMPGDPDYERLWQAVNDNNHGRYRRYQQRTSRPIPVVVLTPAG